MARASRAPAPASDLIATIPSSYNSQQLTMASLMQEIRSHLSTNASMDSVEGMEINADGKAEHLCVLVHG